jgi:mannose-6-phosphate isomerase
MSESIIQPFKKIITKPWGSETIYSPEELGIVGKILEIKAGKRLSLQYHDQKKETLCLLGGQVDLWIGREENNIKAVKMELRSGYTIEPNIIHRLEAKEDSLVLEVSTPEIGTTFRLQDDYARPDESEEIRLNSNRGWKAKE